jgi:hypothetical protein
LNIGIRGLDPGEESSSANYLGLTTRQFEADPTRMAASNDRFVIGRYAVTTTHQAAFSSALLLGTNLCARGLPHERRRGHAPSRRARGTARAGRRADAAGFRAARGVNLRRPRYPSTRRHRVRDAPE